MAVELRQLSVCDGRNVYEMLQDIGSDEYGFTNEVNGMTYDEYKQWLVKQDAYSRAEKLPPGWIPQTTYFLFVDEQPVGIACIRHHSSEELEKSGVGNFGYAIARAYRGQGYGNLLFEKVLPQCKALGYTKIKSFVYIENAASNRVFVRHQATLLGIYHGEKNIYETFVP